MHWCTNPTPASVCIVRVPIPRFCEYKGRVLQPSETAAFMRGGSYSSGSPILEGNDIPFSKD